MIKRSYKKAPDVYGLEIEGSLRMLVRAFRQLEKELIMLSSDKDIDPQIADFVKQLIQQSTDEEYLDAVMSFDSNDGKFIELLNMLQNGVPTKSVKAEGVMYDDSREDFVKYQEVIDDYVNAYVSGTDQEEIEAFERMASLIEPSYHPLLGGKISLIWDNLHDYYDYGNDDDISGDIGILTDEYSDGKLLAAYDEFENVN